MKIILIDSKNAMYRFGYVHSNLSTEDGDPTGAIHGVLMCLLRLKRKHPDARFVMVWDGVGKSWRFDAFPQYKGNRKKEKSEEVSRILAQIPNMQTLASALCIPQMVVDAVEADDLIGVLARQIVEEDLGDPIIYSSDKDFLQFFRWPGLLHIRDVNKEDKLKPESPATIMKHFNCAPKHVLKVRSIAGDDSDGIPNPVEKVGVKTAAKLVAAGVNPMKEVPVDVPDLKGHLAKAYDKLKAVWPQVNLNYHIMRIVTEHDSPLFTKEQRADIKVMMRALRDVSEGNLPDVEPKPLLALLMGLELGQAIEQRNALKRLQTV